MHEFGGLFELTLGEGAFAEHHFAEAIVAIAAGSEDELAAVKKELTLDAAENELELARDAGRINSVEQRKQLVMALDFAGVQR